MTTPTTRAHPRNTPLGRFGLETAVSQPDEYIAVMPVAHLVNPLTGHPTLGPLAVLVDYIAGMVNHHRSTDDEWTVSSELAMELTPDALAVVAAAPEKPVVGTAHPFGAKGVASLGVCELTHDGTVIGTGTVRSVHIVRPEVFADLHTERAPEDGPPPTDLCDIMAVIPGAAGEAVLLQARDRAVNNDMGIVNGGVAAAGLELVAAAALNAGRETPLTTASLRVNFVRQMQCGGDARYEGRLVRAGRRSAVADAEALGADGTVALTGRVTAYC
jgi:acyl-coenzyme A thioesterase PaaI-like protein